MTSKENRSSSNAAVEPAGSPDPTLGEDEVLALLKRSDLAAPTLERIAKTPIARSRKVTLALIRHAKTPRYVALALLRNLFTFDLMSLGLTPGLAVDIKFASEESLINRLEKLSLGEKLSLARRASGRVVAALINQSDARVINMALGNSRITQAMVVKALAHLPSSEVLVQAVRCHSKWSLSPEIQTVLQRRADRSAQNNAGGQTAVESDS
jgi:hypothetical protein